MTVKSTEPLGPSHNVPEPESAAVGGATTVIGIHEGVGLAKHTLEDVTQSCVVPGVVQFTFTVLVVEVKVPSDGFIVHW